MNDKTDPDAWARLRFAIVGPLLATPPEGRELQYALRELAAREWTHPRTGLPVRFAVSTIERWYYSARASTDPVKALRRRVRTDRGQTRTLHHKLIERIQAQYHEHPGWSVQLHYDNLLALAESDASFAPIPSYATIKRYLRARGLLKRRPARRPGAVRAQRRLEQRETRSFEAEYTAGLWHLDFHVGSRAVLEPSGRWLKPVLLGIIDDHSRLVCHLQWYRDATVESLVHGFCQAIAKRGLPRALLSDNGSAMLAAEFVQGLHRLGIVHDTILPYAAHQNGKQEHFWSTLEGRLMAMIESVKHPTLEQLNQWSQVWVERDYHRRVHSEIGTSPLARYLAAPTVAREAPTSGSLRQAFRQHLTRRQRRSDGTVSLAGRRFEIPGRFAHLNTVTLAFARWDLAHVDLIDPATDTILSPLYPQDKRANATGQRRARQSESDTPVSEPSAAAKQTDTNTLPPLMAKLMAEFVATGLPPGFIASPEPRTASDTPTDEGGRS